MNQQTNNSVLALDAGGSRVGVAIASWRTRLPRQLVTLKNDGTIFHRLQELIQQESVTDVVVGLPRGLDGQETGQTAAARQFCAKVEALPGITAHLQDEAVTTKQAESELRARGRPYSREEVDSLAAVYILEDFLREHKEPN